MATKKRIENKEKGIVSDLEQLFEEKSWETLLKIIEEHKHCHHNLSEKLLLNLISGFFKLFKQGHTTGQLKLLERSFNELRYAFKVFNEYPHVKKVSIFGSARTKKDHPNYQETVKIGQILGPKDWMVITGAGPGIMEAGNEGFSKDLSFGLAIQLPAEDRANPFIEGDPKLIHFRYFFTRKLAFLSHSDAVIAAPGGLGTQDELFECLTLMQTGRSNLLPIALLECPGGRYWQHWLNYMKEQLLGEGMISPEDFSFFKICMGAEEACAYIENFYRRFHSYRYVHHQEMIVIRLKRALSTNQCQLLSEQYRDIITQGDIHIPDHPFPEETEHLELPRICFYFINRHFGRLREMIDTINSF